MYVFSQADFVFLWTDFDEAKMPRCVNTVALQYYLTEKLKLKKAKNVKSCLFIYRVQNVYTPIKTVNQVMV